jgi:hypothetical protein
VAYLEPQDLTCLACGMTAELTWVVGEGPNTGPGEPPAYVDILDPGPWTVETTETVPVWAGRVTCPDCGATVLQRPRVLKE